MSLYGTRDAATNWLDKVVKEIIEWGFRRGLYNPRLYFNKATRLKCVVHGDDFVSVGTRQGTAQFRQNLEKIFEIRTKLIGPGE